MLKFWKKTVIAMNSKSLKTYLILFTCSFCFVFMDERQTISLPGKIAVSFNDTCYVLGNSKTTKYQFPINGRDFSYGGFRWRNKSNDLVGVEYLNSEKGGTDVLLALQPL